MWIIALVIVLLILFWFIMAYNGFVKNRNMVEEAFSTMDVYLKKRFDLIPNLVETVKGYASHEKEALQQVVAARYEAMNATTESSRIEAEGEITNTLSRLFALSESYPELKANQNFMELSKQLQNLEHEIAQSRKYYNAIVREYNTKTETFPSVIVAKLFGFKKKPLFTVNSEQERENVRVQF